MMFNKKSIIVFFIIILFSKGYIVFAETNLISKSLIVYENTNEFGYLENKVNHLKELLHVFSKEVDIVKVQDYKYNQINNYDYVFIINIKQDIENSIFLEDLTNFNDRIYWIGDKIENYLEYSKKYDISYNGKNNNIINLNYRDKSLSVSDSNFYNIINTSKNAQITSTISDGYNIYPYSLNEKNLYYISRYIIGSNYIFEDTLNDFYNIENNDKSQIFVRIEDVHPFRNTEKLKEISDYLYSHNIPFIIALIPTYVDSKSGYINTLDSKPEFIETIKYMQNKGGSVILHGYTHQMGREEISGEGYEFWDIKNDRPIDNIESYVKDSVLSGLRLCIENGIYPLGFEAPHYAMDSDGYKEIKKYFSTYVGQYQNNNDNFATSTFPYIIRDSDNFNVFIPENMGYIDEENIFSIEEIKNNFNKLSVVRGYTGGFFYHPYLEIDNLKEVITYLMDNNTQFMNLKTMENYIHIEDISIKSKNGEITCNYDKSKSITTTERDSKQYRFFRGINDIVIGFVSLVLIIFLIIFIVFRKINKGKFIRR